MTQEELLTLAEKAGKNQASDEEKQLFTQEMIRLFKDLKQEINQPS